MMWFNNLKIRNKLIWAFLVMIGITIIVSGMALFSQNYTQMTITKLLDVDGRIARLGWQSHSAMLIALRHEKEYFLNYKELGFEKARVNYVNAVQTQIATILALMAEIQTLETEKEHIEDIQAIEKSIFDYESSFLTVVDLLEKRGLPESGLDGQLHHSFDGLETILKAQQLNQLMNLLLTIRHHEEDYFLRQDKQSFLQRQTAMSQFQQLLAIDIPSSGENHLVNELFSLEKGHHEEMTHSFENKKPEGINAPVSLKPIIKEQLIKLVNQYQTQFEQLVQIDKQIAASREHYQTTIKHLEPHLEEVNDKALEHEIIARAHIENANQTAMWAVMSVSGFAILIGLWIAIFLAHLISKPLTLIVEGAKSLTAGDTALSHLNQTELDKITKRQDEMGDIGHAFNALANYFQIVIQDIVQVSQGLAKGNLQILPQAEYRGDFIQIKQALEATLSNQRQVIEDIVQVSQGLAAGNLNIMPQSKYQGDFIHIKNALKTALLNQRQVIEDIVRVSQGLAAGNLNILPQSDYRGDFAQIKDAQEIALSNQRQVIEDIVQVSQSLVKGHLHIGSKATYQGDFIQIQTALETALTNLRQVVEDIVQMTQGLADGQQNMTPKAEYQGDFVQIKQALEIATSKLAETMNQNATQDWLKTGQAQLNELMSGESKIINLAKKVISFLTTYVEAQVGLFYSLKEVKETETSLNLIASYAYTASDNRRKEFLIGEGLVGQAALERKTICFHRRLEECVHIIQSGLADVLPNHILLIPFLYEDKVIGIIEIGSSQVFTEIQQTFLQQMMPSIGIAINTAKSRTRMQELLEISQCQTEELQSQSEELQAQQEEMQQINDTLQHQREELQTQQTELQQRNEELQSQSEELQTQQEELKQTNETLEERTKQLEKQKADIQQKNRILEKTHGEMKETQIALETKANELELASRYKSEFLANMSHELRTPLNSLLILAQLLSDNKAENLTDKQVEYAKTIHSAGADLLKLINEILDLSKVESGKIEVHIEAVSLADLIEMIEQKFNPVAQEQELEFKMTMADDLPAMLQTDGQRLQQILNNLLSNAFKFTNQGEVRLEIIHSKPPPSSMLQSDELSTISQKEAGRHVFTSSKMISFNVIDTGIGIPNNKQKTIFEAFQQVDGSTSRRYGGTGLGLSISRQLAHLLGGDIVLHSEEEKGSTFTLYLPEILANHSSKSQFVPTEKISVPENGPQLQSDSQPNFISSTEEETGGIADDRAEIHSTDKTLLIIEDEQKFSLLLLELAREKGFKCLVAEDGITGLQLAEQYIPQAIILDIGLPNLDGWKVMEQLKNNPETRHIQVHFISAFDQSLEAKKMGAIGYLLKPVSIEQLGETFQKIEQFMVKKVKEVLIVVDNEVHQQQILHLVGGENIQMTSAITIINALHILKEKLFDCIILDMDIEQRSGGKLLEQMQTIKGLCQTPVIVYTEHELTADEEALLMQCADQLPLKPVNSPEHLLDEATLFLHQVEATLPKDKRNILRMVHDKEAILANKQVLIIDDDARNTFALATILEDKQMEVIAGNNGNEALNLLNTHKNIAIVLMDIMMPEMDGYEAMRQIRAQECFQQLPIIALTAKAMKGDKAKCIEAGANDYLSKPVDTEKLISLMRVWLYR